MFAFDLKSGYHHIEVVQHHRKYLGFAWGQKYSTFSVLPFGLSSAPYAFTKLMCPLVHLWRSKGLRAILYLDNGICAIDSKKAADKASLWVQDSQRHAGLVANEAKCAWVPSHRVQWFGFVIDMSVRCIQSLSKKSLH